MIVPWVVLSAAAQSVEIQVADPLVTALVLECADGTFKAVVREGVAILERVPNGCVVNMVRRSGTIDAPGTWTCTLDTCRREDVAHREVVDAPGRINVIVTSPLPPGATLELTCSGAFRTRAEVVLNTAIFDDVPDEECTLFFKGGVPAKFRPIRAGTWSCTLSNTVAVCTQR